MSSGRRRFLILFLVGLGAYITWCPPSDAKFVNPFGVFAVSALVGMFSDRAAQKLADVFDTLFKTTDQRSGKLAAPIILKLEPEAIQKGSSERLSVRLVGERMGKVSRVRVNDDERNPESVSEKHAVIRLKPEDVANVGSVKLEVVDSEAGTSSPASLQVVELVIEGTGLPDAQIGTEYAAKLKVSGGSGTYGFAISTTHGWLKVDPKTGALSGMPNATGSASVEITVSDRTGAVASKKFELMVV